MIRTPNFVGFVSSFRNMHVQMISRTKNPLSSVIPAKAGIQANSAENKPGFPPCAGMTIQREDHVEENPPISYSVNECQLMITSW